MNKKKFSEHKFFDRFINLTATTFSNKETALIEKGFKFNLKKNNFLNKLEILSVETEFALKNFPNNNYIKHEATDIIKKDCLKEKYQTNDNQTIRTIQPKSKQYHIIFNKADKGNKVVAINEPQYIQKTLDFLDNSNYEKLNINPTEKFHY